jgi:hypothetical protein
MTAVFATVVRQFTDQVFGSFTHVDLEVVFFNLARTLAFRMDRRWPTWT